MAWCLEVEAGGGDHTRTGQPSRSNKGGVIGDAPPLLSALAMGRTQRLHRKPGGSGPAQSAARRSRVPHLCRHSALIAVAHRRGGDTASPPRRAFATQRRQFPLPTRQPGRHRGSARRSASAGKAATQPATDSVRLAPPTDPAQPAGPLALSGSGLPRLLNSTVGAHKSRSQPDARQARAASRLQAATGRPASGKQQLGLLSAPNATVHCRRRRSANAKRLPRPQKSPVPIHNNPARARLPARCPDACSFFDSAAARPTASDGQRGPPLAPPTLAARCRCSCRAGGGGLEAAAARREGVCRSALSRGSAGRVANLLVRCGDLNFQACNQIWPSGWPLDPAATPHPTSPPGIARSAFRHQPTHVSQPHRLPPCGLAESSAGSLAPADRRCPCRPTPSGCGCRNLTWTPRHRSPPPAWSLCGWPPNTAATTGA